MSDDIEFVDPFDEDLNDLGPAAAKLQQARKTAIRKQMTREEAIAHGRALAEDENRKLAARDHLFDPEGRIARAEAYAAWEYDGRRAGTIGKRPTEKERDE